MSASRDYIASIITSGDRAAKIDLIWASQNFHMREEYRPLKHELVALGRDSDAWVRVEVANKQIPESLWRELLNDPSPSVRASALSNSLTGFDMFRAAALDPDMTPFQKKLLAHSAHAVSDAGVFEALWRVKDCDYHLIGTLDDALRQENPVIDGAVVGFVEREILTASRYARSCYCWFSWSVPEVLDTLKDDSFYPVLHHLAANRRAWLSTHAYMAGKHRHPSIRIGIAQTTRSNELLNRIYDGTRSTAIREAVQANPVFIPLS